MQIEMRVTVPDPITGEPKIVTGYFPLSTDLRPGSIIVVTVEEELNMPPDKYTVDDKLERAMRERVVPAAMLDDANKRIAELEAALREALGWISRVYVHENRGTGASDCAIKAMGIIDRALAEGEGGDV